MLKRFFLVFVALWCSCVTAEKRVKPSDVWRTRLSNNSTFLCINGSKYPLHVVRIKRKNYVLASSQVSEIKKRRFFDEKTIKRLKRLKKGIKVCKHASHIHAYEATISPTPTALPDPRYILTGTIRYQDPLAPALNNQPVGEVLVEAFQLPESETSTPVATTVSSSDGKYSLNLFSFGANHYRLQFTHGFDVFTLRDGAEAISDLFSVPADNLHISVLGMKYSLGSYGLPAIVELDQSSSRSASKLPFIGFSIPAVTVPNSIFSCHDPKAPNCSGPCNVSVGSDFCFDKYRNNTLMKSMFEKMGRAEFDQKLILRAGFWRYFQVSQGDPPCTQPDPNKPTIFQKSTPMLTPIPGSETWQYSVQNCATPVPAKDLKPGFNEMIQFFQNAPIAAVSIEEEALYGAKGKTDYLEHLFFQIKQSHPTTRLLQWYSPHKYSNAVNYPAPGNPNFIIPDIANDGWIVDQYPMLTVDEPNNPEGDNIYPHYIQRMFESSNSLTSIAWGSPNWDPSVITMNGSLVPDCDFWNTKGWKRLYVMLAVNRNNFLPTAFDLHTIMKDSSGNWAPIPIWKAHSNYTQPKETLFYNPALEKWFREFQSKTIPYFLSHVKISETLPATRPDWIPEYQYWLNFTPQHPSPECR